MQLRSGNTNAILLACRCTFVDSHARLQTAYQERPDQAIAETLAPGFCKLDDHQVGHLSHQGIISQSCFRNSMARTLSKCVPVRRTQCCSFARACGSNVFPKTSHQLQDSIRDGSHHILSEVEVLVPNNSKDGEEGGYGVRNRHCRNGHKDGSSPARLEEVLHVEPGRHYPGLLPRNFIILHQNIISLSLSLYPGVPSTRVQALGRS